MAAPNPQAVVVLENVLVFAGVRPPSVAMIQSVDRRLGELTASHPKGAGYIHAIYPGRDEFVLQGMQENSRKAFLQMLRTHASAMKSGLVVLGVEGFAGAALRATISGLLLAARNKVPVKVVGKLDDGLAFFLANLRDGGAAVPTEAIVQLALAQARQQIGVQDG